MKRALFSSTAVVAVGMICGAATAQDAQIMQVEDPCSQGFTVADADNSGTLSPTEIEQMSQTLFSRMDADQSGEITRQEYVDCRNTVAGQQSAESDRSMDNMAEADTDQSGTIEQNEFMTSADQAAQDAASGNQDAVIVLRRFVFVPVGMEDQADPASMSRDEVAARSRMQFDSLDANDDGTLTAEEWSQRSGAMPDRSSQVAESFAQMDADGSGSLSQDEYLDGNMTAAAHASDGGPSADTVQDTSSAGSTSDSGSDRASEEPLGDAPVVYFRFEEPL